MVADYYRSSSYPGQTVTSYLNLAALIKDFDADVITSYNNLKMGFVCEGRLTYLFLLIFRHPYIVGSPFRTRYVLKVGALFKYLSFPLLLVVYIIRTRYISSSVITKRLINSWVR